MAVKIALWPTLAVLGLQCLLLNAQQPTFTSNVLKCWQCVIFRGFPTRCPDDAVLYELNGWNACMTWRLANGTTILQNFVHLETDCTEDSKRRWRQRIFDIWQMDGSVDCCTDNECNNEGRLTSQLTEIDGNNNDLSVSVPNIFADQISEIIRQSANRRNQSHFMEDSPFVIQQTQPQRCIQCARFPNAVCNADSSPAQVVQSLRQSSQGGLTPIISNQVRMDFESMVSSMDNSRSQPCRCMDGFLPIMRSGIFEGCHDPIVLTAVIGSRCLISQHCARLNHTFCRDDEELQVDTGISTYQSCQCIDGFQVSDEGECEPSDEVRPLINNSCADDQDCSGTSNAKCGLVSLSNQVQGVIRNSSDRLQTFIGTCQCMDGYIPIKNRFSGRLERCRDPIVRTSTVHGICISQSHCQTLPYTECRSVPDSRIKTCQCQLGFVEMIEDLTSGIISACVRQTSAADTTQFVFQESAFNYEEDFETPLVAQDNANRTEQNTDNNNVLPQLPFPSSLIMDSGGEEALNGVGIDDPGFTFEDYPGDLEPSSPVFTANTPTTTSSTTTTTTMRPSTTTTAPGSANAACQKRMTVVERNEWIPDWMSPLKLDTETGARMHVFYAKLPITARDNDGLLVRLMSRGRLGRNAYFVKIFKNRNVSIGRSFLDSENVETENVQITESSASVRWLSSQEFIGFWILHTNGYTSVGVVNEHNPNKAMLSWQDGDPFGGIDTIGLSAIGAAAFYELDCPLIFSSPGGICAQTEDCENLANTECLNERIEGNVVIRTCQCRSGHIQIPDIQRSFVGGCFDPIGQTKTLHSMCLADIHCTGLPFSNCLRRNESFSEGTCVCNPGFVPMQRSMDNGLILGCRPRTVGDSIVSLESCSHNQTLLERQDWTPLNLLSFRESEEAIEFKDYFYIRFPDVSGSIASIKLLNQRQDPSKFYKITITDGNRISLFENIQSPTFLFEARNEEIIRNSTLFNPRLDTFVGFWTLYRANSGLLQAGLMGQNVPAISWMDRASNRLSDISWIGFETERGGPVEFASGC